MATRVAMPVDRTTHALLALILREALAVTYRLGAIFPPESAAMQEIRLLRDMLRTIDLDDAYTLPQLGTLASRLAFFLEKFLETVARSEPRLAADIHSQLLDMVNLPLVGAPSGTSTRK